MAWILWKIAILFGSTIVVGNKNQSTYVSLVSYSSMHTIWYSLVCRHRQPHTPTQNTLHNTQSETYSISVHTETDVQLQASRRKKLSSKIQMQNIIIACTFLWGGRGAGKKPICTAQIYSSFANVYSNFTFLWCLVLVFRIYGIVD